MKGTTQLGRRNWHFSAVDVRSVRDRGDEGGGAGNMGLGDLACRAKETELDPAGPEKDYT